MFSMILAGHGVAYYVNFNAGEDFIGRYAPHDYILPYGALGEFTGLFQDRAITWASHNAKFELHKLALEGLSLEGEVWCTYSMERVLVNNYMQYSLAACAKRRGWAKDVAVENYIKDNKIYTVKSIPGKKRKDKVPHYDKIPFGIISEYGITDGILHRELALKQMDELNELN